VKQTPAASPILRLLQAQVQGLRSPFVNRRSPILPPGAHGSTVADKAGVISEISQLLLNQLFDEDRRVESPRRVRSC